MSSRRKSRPVRRLDMICSKLQGSGGITSLPPTWTGLDGTMEDEALSPEVADDGCTHTSGSPMSEAGEDSSPDTGTADAEIVVSNEDTATKVLPPYRPPEGVYVLQPESVSDDEEKCEMKLNSRESEGRKRSHGDAETHPVENEYMENGSESYTGLDLSVKRPRIDGTSSECADFETTNNASHMMQPSTSPNLFLENPETMPTIMHDQLEKYHQLMRLVAQQKPLAQAMEEVGLNVHEFFTLHRLNSQLASSKAEKQSKSFTENSKIASSPLALTTVFDKFPPKRDHVSSNVSPMDEEWTRGKANRDAKIQNLLKEAKEDVIQQQKQSSEAQQLNNSRLQQHPTTLNPQMAAALMASLSSNQDQSTEERQVALRKIFLKSHGMLTQNKTPAKAMESFNSSTNSPSVLDRSSNVSKNDSITAGTVSSGVGSIKRGTLDPSNFDEDVFDQYIAKFTNMNRCGLLTCQYYTRDHYHCVVEDCNYQRFTNKADVIRHYNMHKKRDNSLAHGFLRFSPTEDCSAKYPNCHLNGKSTHYHCMQHDCNKVYTSTSDVMTHENFHKKYMQFVCSGFKRFRATEQCDMESCAFRNQKTTHFHCTRTDCNFTFKNKCDIEKHKTYHLRDDQYISKGFKKFYKNETCGSNECVWNYTANHFHCLRPGCNFSFTSTSQMESHKRKHDRNEYMIDGKDEKSGSSLASGCFPPASSSARRPDPPLMSHYKLPPKKLKFTSFIPPTAPQKDMTKLVQITNSYPYPSSGPSMVLSPNRPTAVPPGMHSGRLPAAAAHSRQYLSHSVLSPFSPYMAAVASRVANNGLSVSAQNSPKLPMFNPALFQEAAKKILASMPAASIPHIIGTSNPSHLMIKSEPTHYANINSSQSEPVSPRTPQSARGYANYEMQLGKEKYKDDETWSMARYGDRAEMPLAASSSYSIQRVASPVSSQRPSDHMDMSRASDWPRSTSVISPSMAISAAAALKPPGKIVDTFVPSTHTVIKPDPDEPSNTQVVAYENGLSVTNKDLVYKYFAGAESYKCWIADCDFFTKCHFHCLVENCEAMFTTEDKVMKHIKFHENLESMGATLPIQPIQALSIPWKRSVTPQLSIESDPPPGYIALQSGMPKPSLLEYNDSKQNSGNPSLATNGEQDTENIEEPPAAPADKPMSPFIPNGLAYTQGHLTTLASQIYANALLKGGVSEASHTPMSSTPVSAYRLMPNPASLSALMAKMAQSTPGQGAGESTAATPGETAPLYPPSKKTDNGYIHIKDGMQCLRHDCKYINQNHWHCTINRCRYVCKSLGKAQTHRQAHDSLDAYARSAKESFRSYSVKKPCPNPNCEFRLRGHYHCLKPGCNFATIGTSKLPWHMKKHEKIARREASGFKYYTKKEHCSYQDCKYNGLFSHYHCVRKGCTFAFQYKHQMSTHVRKHLRRMLGRTFTAGEDVQDIDHTNVDSGDDSLPLIIDEMEEAEQRPGPSLEDQRDAEQLSQQQMEVLNRMTNQLKSSSSFAPLNQTQETENSNFDETRDDITMDQDDSSGDSAMEHYEALDLSSFTAGSSKSNESSGQQQMHDAELMNEDSSSNGMGNSTDEGDTNMPGEKSERPPPGYSPMDKSSLGHFNKFKLSEGVLDGFRRFETNENCGDDKCVYINKVSHYHCVRENCSYRFTGRSHMFKHQQHHDRVSGLVRDDFKRFKATHLCEDERCEYRGKNTHFHCLRCSFKCTDSAKVGTHRRQHMKADALEQSGFQRVRGKEDCCRDDCKYRFRNMSHFHCLQPGCNYSIVGLTGIELHADKHKRGLLQPAGAKPVDSTSLIMQNLAAFRNIQMLNAVSMAQRAPDDGGMAHNLSLKTLAAFRDMQQQGLMPQAPRTPTPTGQSDNGHSNQTSPFPMSAQSEPTHLLSKFAFLGAAAPPAVVASSSPATSTSISMVTEGVGS